MIRRSLCGPRQAHSGRDRPLENAPSTHAVGNLPWIDRTNKPWTACQVGHCRSLQWQSASAPGLALLSVRSRVRLLHRLLWPRPEEAPQSGGHARDKSRAEAQPGGRGSASTDPSPNAVLPARSPAGSVGNNPPRLAPSPPPALSPHAAQAGRGRLSLNTGWCFRRRVWECRSAFPGSPPGRPSS